MPISPSTPETRTAITSTATTRIARIHRSPPATEKRAPSQAPAELPTASVRPGPHSTLPFSRNTVSAATVYTRITTTLTALTRTRSYPLRKIRELMIRNPTPAWMKPPYTPMTKKIAISRRRREPVGGCAASTGPAAGFGLKKIDTSTSTITPASTALNTASGTSTAMREPTSAPARAGRPSCRPSAGSKWPLLRKPATAVRFCSMIATRAVPLATLDGRPRKISIGMVRALPPPATVFRKPAATPTTSTRASAGSSTEACRNGARTPTPARPGPRSPWSGCG